MSVFVDRDSRVIIQGFTGQHATFHAEEAIATGTRIVGPALAGLMIASILAASSGRRTFGRAAT